MKMPLEFLNVYYERYIDMFECRMRYNADLDDLIDVQDIVRIVKAPRTTSFGHMEGMLEDRMVR